MKTMQDYEIRCTAEQTIRAYKLGAPIELFRFSIYDGSKKDGLCLIKQDEKHTLLYGKIPTTQQMINWLRKEKHILIYVDQPIKLYAYQIEIDNERCIPNAAYPKPEQAEHAAIDIVFDSLEKGGQL